MQSTEEYLDQLLASVSDEEAEVPQETVEDTMEKSIEDLDVTELTEEALQEQLAMLLGLEIEKDEPEEADDFMAQYAAQMLETSEEDVQEEMDEAFAEDRKEPVSEPQISNTGVLSPDEIAALFASMGSEEDASAPVEETPVSQEAEETVSDEITEEPATIEEEQEMKVETTAVPQVSDTGVLSPDEIAALFASMEEENDNAENSTDIFDELKGAEEEIQEIPDLNLEEETLLDLENVDALLEATAKQAGNANTEEDLLAMEAQMEDDIFSMLAQFEEESVQETMAQAKQEEESFDAVMSFDEEEGLPQELLQEEETQKGKKKKKEKVKKEKIKKEKVKKEKISLKNKFFAFAFDDEEDMEEDIVAEEATETVISEKKKSSKSKKKEKANKKDKKAGNDKPQDENAAIEAELAEEDKKKKQKKEKPVKEKKVKPPKKVKTPEELEAERREERHSIKTKGIVATLLVCASLLGLILVGTYFVPRQLSLASARVAFYAGNYEEVTLRLAGRNLNDSDRLMYEKSNLLYGLQKRYQQYEIYLKRGMEQEALNALLQGLAICKEEEILAEQLDIVTEWKTVKEQFESALLQQYGLEKQSAEIICGLRNPSYTIAVENILAGNPYDDRSSYGGPIGEETEKEETVEVEVSSEENQNPKLEDLLPEEAEILEQLQKENSEAISDMSVQEPQGDKELYSGTVSGGSINFVE